MVQSVVRQVVDIPVITCKYKEYRSYSQKCSSGYCKAGTFPTEANSPISYGSQIEGLIAYLHARQYIPFARMQEIFRDVFGLAISEGGIHYLLKRFAKKSERIYEVIRSKITRQQVIGTDEAGRKVNVENKWFWTWQSEQLTFITASNNRGRQTIEENFEHRFPSSVLVHDCWKPHFKTKALTHQLCLAHLLREINYFNEVYNDN